MIHVIVYSLNSGRVRRVHDPQLHHVPDIQAAHENVPHHPVHEGRVHILLTEVDNNDMRAWQAAASNACGLVPTPLHPDVLAYVQEHATRVLTTVSDWYCVVDANNKILVGTLVDPAVDPPPAGCRFVACPELADERWTFTPPDTFTPP